MTRARSPVPQTEKSTPMTRTTTRTGSTAIGIVRPGLVFASITAAPGKIQRASAAPRCTPAASSRRPHRPQLPLPTASTARRAVWRRRSSWPTSSPATSSSARPIRWGSRPPPPLLSSQVLGWSFQRAPLSSHPRGSPHDTGGARDPEPTQGRLDRRDHGAHAPLPPPHSTIPLSATLVCGVSTLRPPLPSALTRPSPPDEHRALHRLARAHARPHPTRRWPARTRERGTG